MLRPRRPRRFVLSNPYLLILEGTEKTSFLFCNDLQFVYKKDPDLTREGGSIPVTLTFAEKLGVNVLLLPMGRGDDGAQ